MKIKRMYYLILALSMFNNFFSKIAYADGPKIVSISGGSLQNQSKYKILMNCKIELTRVRKTDKEIAEEKAAGTFTAVVKVLSSESCDPHLFCEIGKWGSILEFGTKEVEIKSPNVAPVKAKYYVEKNSLIIQPTLTSQLEFSIRSWDEKFDIKELVIDGRRFVPDICAKSTQEKMETEAFEKEAQGKVKIVNEKNEILKLANEIKDREKLQVEIREKVKAQDDNIEKIRLDLLQIQNEKTQAEHKKLQTIEENKIKTELIEKEKMQKMKTKIKSF